MNSEKSKLLLVKHQDFNARTIDNDITILSEKYNVTIYNAKIGRNISSVTGLARELVFLLLNIFRYKVIYIWFGDYHSYIPALMSRIFRKKCILCLGGYDAHWIIPNQTKNVKEKIRKFCVTKSVKYASHVFPVSHWLSSFLNGLNVKKKTDVAYCCVNQDAFKYSKEAPPAFRKENIVLTVGGGGFLVETKRKKLDFFIEVGNYFTKNFPEYNAKFILIGHDKDTETYNYLKPFVKSSNIKILPVINDSNELLSYYRRAKVYCQFSEYESFGIAVIEAMLNKVIPIVYNGGAMPEVAGDAGIIINDYNIFHTADLIKDILDGKYEKLRDMAKERVINNFTLQRRKEILFKYL